MQGIVSRRSNVVHTLIHLQDQDGAFATSLQDHVTPERMFVVDVNLEANIFLRHHDITELEDHSKIVLIIHRAEVDGVAGVEVDFEPVGLILHIKDDQEIITRSDGRGVLSKVEGGVSLGVHQCKR